jgi:hypothetical protein
VIRQVTTTTTTSNPESKHQPAGLDERAVHQNLLQVEKETLQSVHPTGLSSPTREVIKLHEALMSDEVLLTYVQTSKQPFFPERRIDDLPERYRRFGNHHCPHA